MYLCYESTPFWKVQTMVFIPFSLLEFPHICKASIIKSTASVLVSQSRGCGGDQCSEVSSDSLARSVVKCDITAQYSAVQHSTAQYRGPEQESKPSEEGGHQLRPYLPAPTTPHSALTNSSSLSHQPRFSLLKHTTRQRLGVQRAVRMIICRLNDDTVVTP